MLLKTSSILGTNCFALKIPKAYLAQSDAMEDTTLAQKDIRFARTIQRLQKVIIAELQDGGCSSIHTRV